MDNSYTCVKKKTKTKKNPKMDDVAKELLDRPS